MHDDDHYNEVASKVAEIKARRREREAPELGVDEPEETVQETAARRLAPRAALTEERIAAMWAEQDARAAAAASENGERLAKAEAERRERRRKKVTSAHVLLTFWFASEAEWRRFAAADFAPGATGRTVEHKEWRPKPDWDGEDGYVRRFRYVHTCRAAAGNWRWDAMKYVRSALNRSGQFEEEVQVHVERVRG